MVYLPILDRWQQNWFKSSKTFFFKVTWNKTYFLLETSFLFLSRFVCNLLFLHQSGVSKTPHIFRRKKALSVFMFNIQFLNYRLELFSKLRQISYPILLFIRCLLKLGVWPWVKILLNLEVLFSQSMVSAKYSFSHYE